MTRRSPEIKPRVAHLEGQRQASSSFFRRSSGLLDLGGDAEPSSAGSSFAVHGLSDPQFPDRAALVLGRDPNSSDDGLLVDRHSRAGGNPFEEITQLSLSADLVTLSACDTANGKLEGEEGIDGLAEAFLLAGAKSVVEALWDVEDSATEAKCVILSEAKDLRRLS